MDDLIVPFPFPLKGVDTNWARREQPPLTSPDLLNVVPYDRHGRARGAVRPGTINVFPQPFGPPGGTDREYRPVRSCTTGELTGKFVPAADIHWRQGVASDAGASLPWPPAVPVRIYPFRWLSDGECYIVRDSDPPAMNVGTVNVIPANARLAMASCQSCIDGDDPNAGDYRQCRQCFDDKLVDLWVPAAAIVEYPHYFEWGATGTCYQVLGSDPPSKAPGVIAAARTAKTSCEDGCEGTGQDHFRHLRRCWDHGYTGLWIAEHKIPSYPYYVWVDGQSMYITASSQRSNSPAGYVLQHWSVIDGMHCNETPPDPPPPPPPDPPPCDTCDPEPPDPPPPDPDPPPPDPDPPPPPPDDPDPDPPDPPEPPDSLYLPLRECNNDGEPTGMHVPVDQLTSGESILLIDGRCYQVSNTDQSTDSPGQVPSFTLVADCDADECGWLQAHRCADGEAVDIWIPRSAVPAHLNPYVFKKDGKCYFVNTSSATSPVGTKVTEWDQSMEDCDVPECEQFCLPLRDCEDDSLTEIFIPVADLPDPIGDFTIKRHEDGKCYYVDAGDAQVEEEPNVGGYDVVEAGCESLDCESCAHAEGPFNEGECSITVVVSEGPEANEFQEFAGSWPLTFSGGQYVANLPDMGDSLTRQIIVQCAAGSGHLAQLRRDGTCLIVHSYLRAGPGNGCPTSGSAPWNQSSNTCGLESLPDPGMLVDIEAGGGA